MESQVSELSNLLLNIYSNYIPNKTVLYDEKDPPWITNGIRVVIEMKYNAYKECIRSGMRHNYYVRLENLTTELSNLILVKLVNLSSSAKTYRSILKTFANGRKVPVIPPLLIKMNLFLILRLKLIISTDSLTNIVQQLPRIVPYLLL